MNEQLEFSIILPVCHGGTFLKNALESLHQIDSSSDCYEVIVVGTWDDNESKDIVTIETARFRFPLVYVECDGGNRATQLNAACRISRGRFLVFTDDDCIFRQDWLHKLQNVFSNENNIGIVGGTDAMAPSDSAFDGALNSVLGSFFGTGGFRHGTTSPLGKYYPRLWNMAVPRETALKAALKKQQEPPQVFDESLNVHEDVELAQRIEKQGERIIFAPEVRVGHKRDTTFREFVLRNFIMARTARSLQVHRLAHAVLTAFVLGMPLLAFGSFIVYPLRMVLLVLVAMYTIILLGKGIEGLFRTKNVRMFALIPVLLVSLHLARGFGYLFPWQKQVSEASHET